MNIWAFVTLNQLLQEVLKLKLNLPKNEAVSGKNPIFMIGPFVLAIQFVLKLAIDGAFLYANVVLSFAAP